MRSYDAAEPSPEQTALHQGRPRRDVLVERALWMAVICAFQLYGYTKIANQSSEASPYLALVGAATVVVFAGLGVALLGESGQRGNARILLTAVTVNAVVFIPGEPGDNSWWPVTSAAHGSTVVFLGWFLLRFPDSRLTQPWSRAYLVGAALWIPTTQLASELVPRPWQPTPLGEAATFEDRFDRDATQVYLWLQAIREGPITQALYLGCGILLILRLRRASRIQRRSLKPVLIPGIGLTSLPLLEQWTPLGAAFAESQQGHNLGVLTIYVLLLLLAAGIALARAQRRSAAAVVAELLAVIGESDIDVEQALRRTLEDPMLTVHFCVDSAPPLTAHPSRDERDRLPRLTATSPAASLYVDGRGSPTVPRARPGRTLVTVPDATGQPMAVLDVAATLHEAPTLLEATVRASALALENERLHAQLLVQLDEVRTSRARIVAAGVAERRAVERDLHDGAQQRLLALSTTLARLQVSTHHASEQQELLEQARAELRDTLAELRNLARGIHPAVLSQMGLRAAIESVAERLPVPVSVSVSDVHLSETVETTVYFVVCEALANIVKHSAATRAEVQISGPQPLLIRIQDNGQGMAHPEALSHGSMADRVHGLGGHLEVRATPGDGTLVEAVIPP